MTDDERALVERSHQLQELASHPGWAVLEDFVFFGPGGSQVLQRQVVNGAKSWDEYLKVTGKIHGIHHVVEAPARLKAMADAVAEETSAA